MTFDKLTSLWLTQPGHSSPPLCQARRRHLVMCVCFFIFPTIRGGGGEREDYVIPTFLRYLTQLILCACTACVAEGMTMHMQEIL